MSKLYSLYEQLKKENDEKIYLFRSGIFYISLADDAKELSNRFDFKLTKLNDSVVKCGFPASSIAKYSKIFTNNNINFQIIDTTTNVSYSPADYTIDNKITGLLNSISAIKIDELSVSQSYKALEDLKEQVSEILKDQNEKKK